MESVMLLWWTANLAWGTCTLPPQESPRIPLPEPADDLALVIEVPFEEEHPERSEAWLALISGHGGHAALRMSSSGPNARAAAATAMTAGHDVVITTPTGDLDHEAAKARYRAIRKAFSPLKLKSVAVFPGGMRLESAAIAVGFTAVIVEDRHGDLPRYAAHNRNQPAAFLAIPTGTFRGDCGDDPVVAQFGAAEADRVARALRDARRRPGFSVVRLVLPDRAPTEAEVQSWAQFAANGHLAALARTPASLHSPGVRWLQRASPREADGTAQGAEYVLEVSAVLGAARQMLDTGRFEATAGPGPANPTELWIGLARILAGQTEGDEVVMPPLGPPPEDPRRPRAEPLAVEPAVITALLQTFTQKLPASVPGTVRIGEALVDPVELLQLMSAAALGEPPVVKPHNDLAPPTWGPTRTAAPR